ncbi:MAG: sugar phosphate isomerase/epimerase [Phycisphaerae bacterium]|nr:sugar phosphate isomerase/epimerase [Phycisphaerae bacterium]
MKPLDIGVCSWSLAIKDLSKTLATVQQELGFAVVQVGFFGEAIPAEGEMDSIIQTVADSGLEVSATCIGFVDEDYSTLPRIAATGGYVPDDRFEQRFAETVRVADLTVKLGVDKLATHVGFVPHDRSAPRYQTMVDRVKRVADALGQRSLMLLMETGQEQAEALATFIADVGRTNVRVNFDPANMILYGIGEPTEAIDVLRDHIAHVHMKDATWSAQPGKTWGQEVPLGDGDADIPRVVSKLRTIGYQGPLVIEREAGHDRLGDIRYASELLQSLLG